MERICEELRELQEPGREPVTPSGHGCKECLADGTEWVHLRLCLSCGHVGCCDSSPGKHATKHFHRTQHAVMRSFEPHEEWAWCYVHQLMADGVPAMPGEMPPRHYSAPEAHHA